MFVIDAALLKICMLFFRGMVAELVTVNQKRKRRLAKCSCMFTSNVESSNDWFCRVHFDRWTTFSLSCATLLGHKCSASRFQHNVTARNKVREKVSLSCFEQLKFGRASVICKLQEEIHVSDCISRHLMQLCAEVAQDLTRRTCIDCCAWSLPSLIARSGKGFISTHVELERNSKTPEIVREEKRRRKKIKKEKVSEERRCRCAKR